MQEFTSVKVSETQSDDLAEQLTSMSAQGWEVVNIVTANSEIIAFLSRATQATTDLAGWAATDSPVADPVAPTVPSTFITPTPASAPAPVVTSTAISAPAVPADWYKDPAGRYEFRYWDGSKWTENVSRAGVMFKDPPTK